MEELLNGGSPTVKIFLKKMKMRRDYLPILINLGIGFALFLVLPMIRNL